MDLAEEFIYKEQNKETPLKYDKQTPVKVIDR
mgnify:CR=1